ncbi:MAG: L-serine ammonia-lyase [Opitutales bacterium]|nr:L-serine ammonia-lyase [Opitutales bacterium]
MAISLFDLFKTGIGPSSSHTVGPMIAARQFLDGLNQRQLLPTVRKINIELFGSLGATGRGHGTGKAILLGLTGALPEKVDPDTIEDTVNRITQSGTLELMNKYPVGFNYVEDIIFHRMKHLDYHSNGLTFSAWASSGELIGKQTFYSIGGGFVLAENEAGEIELPADTTRLPYNFSSGAELIELCGEQERSIAEIMLSNEMSWREETEVKEGILALWRVMQECVEKGIHREGILPGGLNIKRRAAKLYRELRQQNRIDRVTPSLGAMDWVNLYALAVNEENAAGGRVVTAPTNGAAGIIPAVLHYYWNFCPGSCEEGIIEFFLTAAAIGILCKKNASISGAEVGCQGEVGSACAMAAAGLAAATGGTPAQIENAAEIGIEHNLGLTCDPIGGLVQIPCIERNAMAAVKAINSATLALRGDGAHYVSLDKAIRTMRDTGRDMSDKYKETSRGGLAVNVPDC